MGTVLVYCPEMAHCPCRRCAWHNMGGPWFWWCYRRPEDGGGMVKVTTCPYCNAQLLPLGYCVPAEVKQGDS